MKTKFRVFALLLCIVMAILPIMTACDKNTPTPDGGNTPEAPVGNPMMLIKDKLTSYQVVYASTLTEPGVSAAQEIYNLLKSRTVQEPVLGKDTEVAESEYEILIGNTNRAESKTVMDSMTGYSYAVRVIGKKIVFCASRDWMLSNAVKAFNKTLTYERDSNKDINTATFMDNTALDYDYTKNTDYSRTNWSISKFPPFFGGILVDKEFTDTMGFIDTSPSTKDYKMLMATDTELDDFIAYADGLAANGFTVTAHAQHKASIVSYWVESGDNRMYMYYTASTKQARFILDQNDTVPLSEFEYTYEKQSGETTAFYLYGLKMHEDGINVGEIYPSTADKVYNKETGKMETNTKKSAAIAFYNKYPELKSMDGVEQNTYKNCGSMFVIKMADNSVMIIDGGEYKMMCVEQAVYLNNFLHKITNTPANEKVRINCWYISHPHGDHFTGFIRFMNGFHSLYEVERVMYTIEHDSVSDLRNFVGKEYLQKWYPDIVYHKLHTGESFQIADVKIDVLFTMEDLVRPGSMTCEFWPEGMTEEDAYKNKKADENNTSSVTRFTIDGCTFLHTGDTANEASLVLLRNYPAADYAELKADIMQVPHHGWNNLPDLFNAISPSISVFNQSSGGAIRGLTGGAEKTYNSVVAATEGGASNLYFAGDETVGFKVVNGKFRYFFREDAVGYAWDRSDGGTEYRWETWTKFPSAYLPAEVK